MDAAALHCLYQGTEVAVSRKQNDLVDVLSELHRIDRNLDVHIAFDLPMPAGVDIFFRGLGDDRVAIVIKPVDQGTDRRIFLIFNDRGVIKGTYERATTLKFPEKAFVVDVKTERLAGGIEICAVDK